MTHRLNTAIHPLFHAKIDGGIKMTLVREDAPGYKALDVFPRLLRRLLGIEKFSMARKLMLSTLDSTKDVWTRYAEAMKIAVVIQPEVTEKIATTGGLLVIANHPLALAEAFALGSYLNKIRPARSGQVAEIKLLLTDFLKYLPEFHGHAIFVNTMKDGDNQQPIVDSIDWLRSGHVLVVFPAGDISYKKRGEKYPADPPWSGGVAKLLHETQVTVQPVYVHGGLSNFYNSVRSYLPRLGNVLAIREMMKQSGTGIQFSVGEPVPYKDLADLKSDEIIAYLRLKTYGAGGVVECFRSM